jgi:hypothetical protein
MPSDTALSTSWLAARWGVEPVLLEVRRRAGELFATWDPDSDEWRYPSWQFDDEGEVKPEVSRALAAAREAGVSGQKLDGLLRRRVGLAGGRTVLDELLAGDDRPLLEALSS